MFLKLNITKPSAYWLYLFIKGADSLGFTMAFTVNIVYQVTEVGLNPLQLVLVGTTFEVASFLFEIPTGIVADVYSRRLSIIIGYALLGFGLIIEGSIPVFEALILSAVCMGIGFTFISGATSAWIVDEIGQDNASQAFLRASQVAQIMSFIGIFISIALASTQLSLAILVGGTVIIGLSIILMLIMPEEGFQRISTSERDSWSDLFSTFRQGVKLVRARRILLIILLITLIFGAFTEGFDRLWTVHILTNFTLPEQIDEIAWFGIISAVFIPVTLLATELVRRKVDLADSHAVAHVLSVVYSALIFSVLLFTLSQSFALVLLGLWITSMLKTIRFPLMEAWINLHTKSNVRATVLSIWGQSDALGQITGGPIVGAIGVFAGVRIAISVSALMLNPLILVFNQTLKQKG